MVALKRISAQVGSGGTPNVSTFGGKGSEESPGSVGQDAGEIPRRGDPWTVQQRANRLRI